MSDIRLPARPDYLRVIGPDVAAIVRLVLHDILSTSALSPEDARRLAESRGANFRAASADGYIYDAAETALWIAEAVQEDLIEGRNGFKPLVTWPACPDHPADHHPLWLRQKGENDPTAAETGWDDPAWTCPRTGAVIAELGQL